MRSRLILLIIACTVLVQFAPPPTPASGRVKEFYLGLFAALRAANNPKPLVEKARTPPNLSPAGWFGGMRATKWHVSLQLPLAPLPSREGPGVGLIPLQEGYTLFVNKTNGYNNGSQIRGQFSAEVSGPAGESRRCAS